MTLTDDLGTSYLGGKCSYIPKLNYITILPAILHSCSVCITVYVSNAYVQIPEEEGCEKYDFKVIHQIIRELTIGIYILNQVPSISLEANFDCSTSVQLPPAYIDTKVKKLNNLTCLQ